jgi:glyoxylase-like metal-dependent hydrolase (beta-lactamase superfamily II)
VSPLLPLLFLLASAPNAAPAEERVGQELGPGVHLIPGSVVRRKLPDGNTVVLEGRDGLVIFDTGRHPAHVEQIDALAGQLGSTPKAIVNSHWHLDPLT